MAQDDLQAAIDELYGAPLDAFSAERARLARELRSGGDRSTAAEIAKLSKPSGPAWALNHIAREAPEAVSEWVDTAAALREASADPAATGADRLRAAMAAHRSATARLTSLVSERARPAGKPLSSSMLDRVGALLRAATADEDLAERFAAGWVTEAPAGSDAPPAPSRHPAPKVPPEAPPAPDPEAEARAARRNELEQRVRAALAELGRLRERAAEREAAAAAADERLEEARRTLRRSESKAGAAHDAVDDVRDAISGAENDLRELQAELKRLGF